MIKQLFSVAIVIGGIAMIWKFAYPTCSVRYRLTLEADVDGQSVIGSGVIQVNYVKRPQLLPEMQPVEKSVEGEAVALDFGQRGVLFAVLHQGANSRTGPKDILPYAWGQREIWSHDDVYRIREWSGSKDLSFDRLPLLVRFRDINDPTTVESVDPANLTTRFGPGVKLVRVTIAITDDPVTSGIEKKLSWLPSKYPDQRVVPWDGLGGPARDETILLTYSDFLRGQK